MTGWSENRVDEHVLVGPRQRTHGTIRLQARSDGVQAVGTGVRIEGVDLVWDSGRVPLTGRTCAELAAAVGATTGTHPDASGVTPDETLAVDCAAAILPVDCLARGDAGLRLFAPGSEPVLWPEHFDVGIDLDEVGEFWNVVFGARRRAEDLPDASAVATFFDEGRKRAGQGERR